jgi:hypothetical protein
MIIRMSTISPADFQTDDLWVANRVAEALATSVALENSQVTIDTFTDIDRGYFRRTGVLDRLSNPRLGFHVVQNLYSLLNSNSTPISIKHVFQSEHTRSLVLKRGSRNLILVMPSKTGVAFDVSGDIGPEYSESISSATDLKTGNITANIPFRLEAPILLIE